MEKARQSISEISRLLVAALIASLLVVIAPFQAPSQADYIDSNTGPILYNNRVCNLGDPNDHSTSATAFEISTSEQLWEITDCVSNSATIFFELGDNIDVSQASTAPTNSPIGYSSSGDISFSGVLDGNNKTISGLNMSTTSYGVGLFAWLAGATVSDLVISGAFETFTTGTNSEDSAGALAVRASGAIHLISVSNRASVEGNWRVGGLVGHLSGDASIASSNNTGTVSGGERVGGLIGDIDSSTATISISISYNAGTIGTAGSSKNVGGLVGKGNGTDFMLFETANLGTISGAERTGGLLGGIVRNSTIVRSFNTGPIQGGISAGGLIGQVQNSPVISESYNTAPVNGSSEVDGLVGEPGQAGSTVSVLVSSTYVRVASQHAASNTLDEMKVADTYVGFDFVNDWGFGVCADNGAFPLVRSLNLATTHFSYSCDSNTAGAQSQPGSQPAGGAVTPPAVYEGPVVHSAVTTEVAGVANYDGKRLDTVTKVMAGDLELTIRSATSQSLELQLPASLEAGLYDLVLLSSYGTLSFQQGLRVVAGPAAVEPEETETSVDGPVLTVGSFKGYIAIYTKGYEGQRLSAKVAGKWLVVPELDENWRSYNFSRTVRFTGAGREITVDLYIDRKFVKSEQLVTK